MNGTHASPLKRIFLCPITLTRFSKLGVALCPRPNCIAEGKTSSKIDMEPIRTCQAQSIKMCNAITTTGRVTSSHKGTNYALNAKGSFLQIDHRRKIQTRCPFRNDPRSPMSKVEELRIKLMVLSNLHHRVSLTRPCDARTKTNTLHFGRTWCCDQGHNIDNGET